MNIAKNDVYYKLLGVGCDGMAIVDKSKPLDKDGKPLISTEVYNGIHDREVNELKESK